ncbi:unnamed protein product [Prorocentrum cordatum]|uniref:Potassium channel domain-containing protein n=1 Tax=Prorocentrum cordatum TaxID=2364126 RepID=A0ABN9TVL4_9DINO|nr:unnamed protein product [Polarella glacialis]
MFELDCHSRIFSMASSAHSDLPALVSSDFGQAFPSLSRERLHLALGTMRIPEQLKLFVVALYTDVLCYGAFMSATVSLFLQGCGIIQGCPAPGTLFALATDGFYQDMELSLATALRRLAPTKIRARIFSVAGRIAALKLKANKFKIAPLAAAISMELASRNGAQEVDEARGRGMTYHLESLDRLNDVANDDALRTKKLQTDLIVLMVMDRHLEDFCGKVADIGKTDDEYSVYWSAAHGSFVYEAKALCFLLFGTPWHGRMAAAQADGPAGPDEALLDMRRKLFRAFGELVEAYMSHQHLGSRGSAASLAAPARAASELARIAGIAELAETAGMASAAEEVEARVIGRQLGTWEVELEALRSGGGPPAAAAARSPSAEAPAAQLLRKAQLGGAAMFDALAAARQWQPPQREPAVEAPVAQRPAPGPQHLGSARPQAATARPQASQRVAAAPSAAEAPSGCHLRSALPIHLGPPFLSLCTAAPPASGRPVAQPEPAAQAPCSGAPLAQAPAGPPIAKRALRREASAPLLAYSAPAAAPLQGCAAARGRPPTASPPAAARPDALAAAPGRSPPPAGRRGRPSVQVMTPVVCRLADCERGGPGGPPRGSAAAPPGGEAGREGRRTSSQPAPLQRGYTALTAQCWHVPEAAFGALRSDFGTDSGAESDELAKLAVQSWAAEANDAVASLGGFEHTAGSSLGAFKSGDVQVEWASEPSRGVPIDNVFARDLYGDTEAVDDCPAVSPHASMTGRSPSQLTNISGVRSMAESYVTDVFRVKSMAESCVTDIVIAVADGMQSLPAKIQQKMRAHWRLLTACLFMVSLGVVMGMVFEDWEFLTSLYVIVQIVTTIGYGDVTVQTDWMKLFMAFYVLAALLVVANFFNLIMDVVIESNVQTIRSRLRKVEIGALASIHNDEEAKEAWGTTNRAVSAAVLLVFAISTGTLFFRFAESCTCSYGNTQEDFDLQQCDESSYDTCVATEGLQMSWASAFYMSVITVTTVGFGDHSPKSRIGRIVGIIWMLLGVAVTAYCSGLVRRLGAGGREDRVRGRAEHQRGGLPPDGQGRKRLPFEGRVRALRVGEAQPCVQGHPRRHLRQVRRHGHRRTGPADLPDAAQGRAGGPEAQAACGGGGGRACGRAAARGRLAEVAARGRLAEVAARGLLAEVAAEAGPLDTARVLTRRCLPKTV